MTPKKHLHTKFQACYMYQYGETEMNECSVTFEFTSIGY